MRSRWDFPLFLICSFIPVAMLVYFIFFEPQLRLLDGHDDVIAGVAIHLFFVATLILKIPAITWIGVFFCGCYWLVTLA